MAVAFRGNGTALGGGSSSSHPRPSAPPSETQQSSLPSSYYRDPIFAILFLVQLSLVVAVAVGLGPTALASLQKEQSTVRLDDVLWFAGVTLASSLLPSVVCFWILSRYAEMCVQLAFFAAPATSVVVAAIATYTTGSFRPELWYAVAGVSILTAGVYHFMVRRYVPFAASNLRVAMAAITDHSGLVALALVNVVLVSAWLLTWLSAALGVYQWFESKDPVPPRRMPCPDAPHHLCNVEEYDPQPLVATATLLLSLLW
jgi:hypothetical protein